MFDRETMLEWFFKKIVVWPGEVLKQSPAIFCVRCKSAWRLYFRESILSCTVLLSSLRFMSPIVRPVTTQDIDTRGKCQRSCWNAEGFDLYSNWYSLASTDVSTRWSKTQVNTPRFAKKKDQEAILFIECILNIIIAIARCQDMSTYFIRFFGGGLM